MGLKPLDVHASGTRCSNIIFLFRHLIHNRNYELLSKNHVRDENECKFQANTVNWLHSFTNIIENEGHGKDSIAKLH